MRKKDLLKEIERIKKALIDFRPDYFKIAFCDHEPEEIKLQDFEGKSTSGFTDEVYYRCKKCGCIVDEFGSPKIGKRW